MQLTRLVTGTLILLFVLTGCYHSRFDTGINVMNSPGDRTLCVSGLEAKGNYNSVIAETGKVPPGKMDIVRFLTPETVGTLVTIEAWCYGATGKEIGYTKISGPYSYGPTLGTSVRPPLRDKAQTDCDTPTEQRGEEICIRIPII